jgi:two-component system, chemotaxis family, chemotaxis protein CheY
MTEVCCPARDAVPNILIADDSRFMREVLLGSFRGQPGLELHQAATGRAAIEQLSTRKVDLVILDLTMPDLGGYEVLEFARAQDGLKNLPILVLTSRDDPEAKERALALGATEFLTKPFDPKTVLDLVRSLLARAGVK